MNCHRNTGTGREYEGCERCYFRYLARLYLGTSHRWQEIRNIWEKQGGRCPYTGIKLDFGVDASLDHIKPSSLYPELANDPSNLEFVHLDANRMKRNMGKEEFLDFVRLIVNNLGLMKEADTPHRLFKDQDED